MNNDKAIREINSMQTFSDFEVSEKENAISRTIELIFSYVEIDTIILNVRYIDIERGENPTQMITGKDTNFYYMNLEGRTLSDAHESTLDNVFSAIHYLFSYAKRLNDEFFYPTTINVNNFSADRGDFIITLDVISTDTDFDYTSDYPKGII